MYRKRVKNEGPKKPLSAYLFFTQEQRPILKAANTTMSFQDLTKTLGTMWGECADRSRYTELADKNKQEYLKLVADTRKTPVVDATAEPAVAEKPKRSRAKKAAAPAVAEVAAVEATA